MSDFDAEMVLREARQRLPLRRLLVEYGHAPKEPEGWKAFTCPHCGKKKAGVFRGREGAELFKCFSGRCPTMNVALDEVGYVAYVSRLNRKEAFKTFLKMAGVSDRRPPCEKKEEGASDDDLLKQAGELAREEGRAECPGTDWLREKLGVGYRRAKRLAEKWSESGRLADVKEVSSTASSEQSVPRATGHVAVEAGHEPSNAPPKDGADELEPLPETDEEDVEAPVRVAGRAVSSGRHGRRRSLCPL